MKKTISMKIYFKLYKEHCELLCKYITLKSKYEKLIKSYDEDFIEVVE